MKEVHFAAPAKSYTAPNSPQKHNIAILGGGITGLSAAHYLTRELPTAKVTIYEASERLGGWLQSKSVDVGNGNVVFESGPRTLRPTTAAGMVTVEMVRSDCTLNSVAAYLLFACIQIEKLNLKDELLVTSITSDAARNRFIYYPDHLVKMPGPGQDLYSMLWNVITESVFDGLPIGAIFEFRRPQRATWAQYNNPEVDDESVGSFLERRLGTPDVGNNLVSAVLHGIYAGDINQLSARSLMPKFWYGEALQGSLTRATIKNIQAQAITEPYNDIILRQEMQPKISQPMNMMMAGASVYTFKQGIGALSCALEKSLRANQNVEIKTGHTIKGLEHDGQSNDISVCLPAPPMFNTNSPGQNIQKHASTKTHQRNLHPLRPHTLHNRKCPHPSQHARRNGHGSEPLLYRHRSPPRTRFRLPHSTLYTIRAEP